MSRVHRVCSLWNTVVTGQGIGKKNVFLLRARADVVDGKRDARRRFPVADDHYVRQLPADHDRHNVAVRVVFQLRRRKFRFGSRLKHEG